MWRDYPGMSCPDILSMFAAPVHPCTRGIRPSMDIIQRGNNRNIIFASGEDIYCSQDGLYDACKQHDILIHAYVLDIWGQCKN